MFPSQFRRFFVLIMMVGLLTAVLRLGTAVTAQQPVAPPAPDERTLLPHLPTEEADQEAGQAILYPPDWSKGVFQSYRDGNWEIYSSQPPYRLTNHGSSDMHPRYNRGATHIVFSSNRDGDYEIYVMNIVGADLQQLTHNGAHDVNPVWSPDGSQIAFQSYRDGQAEVYVMDANGLNEQRLTAHGSYDGEPTWSPDGSQIAFTSARTGTPYIYVMNSDGTAVTRLSNQPSVYPAWSPDGSQIAYSGDQDGDGWLELWLMNADGSNQHILYDPPFHVEQDAWARGWSPDGREITFTSIKFILYQGNWYWEWAYARSYDLSIGDAHNLDQAGVEWHPDWQTMDVTPPLTELESIPTYSQAADFYVRWSGVDQQWGAGIGAYDVQYRVGAGGPWVDWQTGVTTTSALYTAVPGTAVSFRARARDNAFNYEVWPTTDNPTTTFYTWALEGKLTDNRGAPLAQAPLTISPLPLNVAITDDNGDFFSRLKTEGSHTLDVNRSGYGDLASTSLNMENLAHIYLPPANNVLLNGGFEAVSPLTNWTTSGEVTAVTNPRHTGQAAVLMGQECPFPCLSDADDWTWADYASSSMVTDSNGVLHVVWSGALLSEVEKYYYVNRTVDGNWSPPFILSNSSNYIPPVITVDKFDNIHVVWREEEDSGRIYYRRRLASGNWTTSQLVPAPAGFPRNVIVDEHGRVHLMVLAGISEVIYLERSANGSWQPYIELSTPYSEGGAMAMSPNGDLAFFWMEELNTYYNRHKLFFQVRYANGVWGNKEMLFPDNNYFVPEPYHIVVSENNTIHVFWHANYATNHAFRSPLGHWSTPESLPQSHAVIDVASDSNGNLHLINIDRSGANAGVYYRLWTPDTGWVMPFTLNTEYPHRQPAIAIDKSDVVHLLWANGALEGVSYRTSSASSTSEVAQLNQTIAIPGDMTHPTLSFMARQFRNIPGDASGLELLVSDGVTTTAVPLPTGGAAWAHYWADLSPWAGQTVTVDFRLTQVSGDPRVQAAIDDVTLGSSYPDTWVWGVGPGSALPGETVVLTLEYGNNGRVPSTAAELALTWPDALTFVSANVTPTVGANTLTWDVGDLATEAAPATIVVTATVDAAIPFWQTINLPVSLNAATTEVEQQNNQAIISILIAYRQFLPMLAKP